MGVCVCVLERESVCDGWTEKCEFCLDVDAACDCIEKVDVVCVRACVCVCLCVCDGFTKKCEFFLDVYAACDCSQMVAVVWG